MRSPLSVEGAIPQDAIRKRGEKKNDPNNKKNNKNIDIMGKKQYHPASQRHQRPGMISTYNNHDFYQRAASPASSTSSSDGHESSFLLHQALLPPSPNTPPTVNSDLHQFYPNNEDTNNNTIGGSSLSRRANVSSPLSKNNLILRRNKLKSSSKQKKKLRSRKMSCLRFLRQLSYSSKTDDTTKNSTALLALAILSWYCLGVVSISSSKLLLGGGIFNIQIPPLMLTCQQFWIGSKVLSSPTTREMNEKNQHHYLNMSGFYFSLGFFLTNLSFFSSHASFVETVKAAEPLSSATIAKLWGIESNISSGEVMSLIGITFGIILSTIGNASGTYHTHNDDDTSAAMGGLIQSVQVCAIVLISNFCFSFRGMYQKLYSQKMREKQQQQSKAMCDHRDLQYFMQSLGFRLFIIPTLLWDGHGIYKSLMLWFSRHMEENDGTMRFLSYIFKESLQYIILAIVNGLAFTSYK